MTATGDKVFPLIPSRKSRTLEVAGRSSRRRGAGDEMASSRPYRRGDAIRSIDWPASARLSTARGSDEFVVREHFAEDVVRVIVMVDRGPSMGLFPEWLPWLHKPAVAREAAAMIVASGVAAGALIGFAEAGADGPRIDRPARDAMLRRAIEHRARTGAADGRPDSLEQTLALSLRYRSHALPAGTFVFVLSDFLSPLDPETLHAAVATGWDVVPVIIQDPVWERSFPDVSGVTVPLSDPRDGALALVRLSRSKTRDRRRANEARAAALGTALAELGLDPVSLTSSDQGAIHAAFVGWAERRHSSGRGRR